LENGRFALYETPIMRALLNLDSWTRDTGTKESVSLRQGRKNLVTASAPGLRAAEIAETRKPTSPPSY
jgi:hypothetical protein